MHVIVFQKPHPYGSLDIKKLKDLIAKEANPSQETVLERQRLLAKTFRELMTNGQKFTQVNAYRRSFFDEVIALVEEVGFPSYSSSYRMIQRGHQGCKEQASFVGNSWERYRKCRTSAPDIP
jgi:hypothetical protein